MRLAKLERQRRESQPRGMVLLDEEIAHAIGEPFFALAPRPVGKRIGPRSRRTTERRYDIAPPILIDRHVRHGSRTASHPTQKRRFGVRGLWYEEEEAMGKVFLTALCAPALLADHFREV